nr:hypothetical protein [Pandoravirus belohorizontensis]
MQNSDNTPYAVLREGDVAPSDSFAFARLPSLPLERVFDAYIADGVRDAGCIRAARSWIASHWRMIALAEFDRAAKRIHATLALPSVVIGGIRVHEWKGLGGAISDNRGSVTLVLGACGPSGKSTTAQFIETLMLCEMNRMRGGSRDTPLDSSRIHRLLIGTGGLEDDIAFAIALSRRRKFAADHSDGPRTLLLDGPSIVNHPCHAGARECDKLARIAATARESNAHIVVVHTRYDGRLPDDISREVDRIVITAGADRSHRAEAASFAPILGMDTFALAALLDCMRPFARLVFERCARSRVGVDAFTAPATTVSIAGGLSDFFPSALKSASP